MSKATKKPDPDLDLGTLIVVLLKARNLNDKHSFWKQDVFAQATLNGVQKRSHVDIKGGQHPEWDSETRFTVLKGSGPGGRHRKLEVACYAQESKKEDLLGQATVDISDTLKTGEFDDWVSLDVDGVVRGEIYLEMTYYANEPAPAAAPNNKFLTHVQGIALGRRPSKLSPSDRLSRPIQQSDTGPSRFSPKQPSRLHDQSNPPSSYLTNVVSPTSKHGSLSFLPADELVHAGAAQSNTRDLRSLSPPQVMPSQLAVLPSILRPGSGGPTPVLEPRQQRDFGHNHTSSGSSISSNSRPHSAASDISFSPPNPYTGGSGAYTPVHSGSSKIDGSLSPNPYTGSSGTYLTAQQHQQVSNGRAYSPTPGTFVSQNQPGSQSPASRVQASGSSNLDGAVFLNPYIKDSGAFILGGQHQQISDRQAYPLVSPTMSVQVSGPSHSSVPISVSPPNSYARNGGVYLPGPDVSSYPPASPPVSVHTSGSSNMNHSVPTDPYIGASGSFTPAYQQAPDGRAYSPVPPVNTTQTSNYVTSVQAPSVPSLPYNAGTAGSSIPSEPLAFPRPVIPVVMEPYRHHEPSSFMRPGLGGRSESSSYYQPPLPPPRTSSVSNKRSEHEEMLDPYRLARYQTPLPLPPGSVKESPLPPPPPAPTTPPQVSSPPPVVASTPAPNTARVEALRKMEQDAARRKEQELKDLELAMQLDRELNL